MRLRLYALSIAGCLLYGILLVMAGLHNRYACNPDGVAYLRIAEYYFHGQTDIMVSGYWGPMFSWIAAPLLAVVASPLDAGRITMGISAIIFVFGSWSLYRRLELGRGARHPGYAAHGGHEHRLVRPVDLYRSPCGRPDLSGRKPPVLHLVARLDQDATGGGGLVRGRLLRQGHRPAHVPGHVGAVGGGLDRPPQGNSPSNRRPGGYHDHLFRGGCPLDYHPLFEVSPAGVFHHAQDRACLGRPH